MLGKLKFEKDAGCLVNEQGLMVGDVGFVGIDSMAWGERICLAVNNFDALLDACKLVDRAHCGDGVDMATAVDACLLALANAKA